MSTRLALLMLLASAPIAPLAAQSAPAAASGPQPITRSVFVQRIDALFAAADANKDGFADRAELESGQAREMAERKAFAIKQREAAFKQLDKDNNGMLTLAEFNAVANATPLPKADAGPVLSRFDTNKDGKVSPAENRAPALAQFDRIDKNKDGTLSVAEQQASATRR